MGNVGEGTSVYDGGSLLGGLHQIGLQSILQEHTDGTCHTHILHSEGGAIGLDAQQDVLYTASEIVLTGGQTQDGHDFAGRCDVESTLHHHPVGLGSQSRHDGAQVAVVHVEHPLPQHFAQREALVAMLVDVVVKQSRYHVVSRGDGMEVTCKVQVDLVHRQHLGMATACRPALHAEAGPQRRLAQSHHRVLADTVKAKDKSYAHCGLADACLCGRDGSHQYQLMSCGTLLVYQRQRQLGSVSSILFDVVCPYSQALCHLGNRLQRGLPRYFDICLHQRCFCLIIYIYSQMYSFFLVRQGKSLYFCKALHIIKHDRT